MSVETLVIWIIVGGVAGFLAGVIVRGYGLGVVGNVIVGIVGAFLAGWMLPAMGASFAVINPLITAIVHATIGAVVLLLVIGLLRRTAA
jgi:uncharacterized membrane protein YeaQ/YmgE (transglycosylase-associated protein family)